MGDLLLSKRSNHFVGLPPSPSAPSVAHIMLCVVVMMLLSGCVPSKESNVVFLNDLINCDIVEAGDKFGFDLTCLYAGMKPQIDFVSFDNENANARFIEMIDDTFSSISGISYKGYSCLMLGFSFDISSMEARSTHSIDEITLNVNGREVSVDVAGQIKLIKASDTEEKYRGDDVYSTNVPVVIFSNGKAIESVSFNYHTDRSVTIRGFQFNNYLNVTESVVFVDGTELGSIEDSFPVNVPGDAAIRIDVAAGYGEYDDFSDFYANSLLLYADSDGEERILKDYITIQAVANFTDLSNLIDQKIS